MRLFGKRDEAGFRRVMLVLLLLSGSGQSCPALGTIEVT